VGVCSFCRGFSGNLRGIWGNLVLFGDFAMFWGILVIICLFFVFFWEFGDVWGWYNTVFGVFCVL